MEVAKKTIVHVIDDLGRGGTETLLMDLLPNLSQHFNIVLVTLGTRNDFGKDQLKWCHGYYCLNYKGFSSIVASIWKLRKIIKRHKPCLVRSQLVMSTVICRIACPKRIPLVFSIHNTLSVLISKNIRGRVIRLIERNIRKKNVFMLGVTRTIVEDYVSTFNYKGSYSILYNYVRDDFFSIPYHRNSWKGDRLKLVAIGNLRTQKNYPYLVDEFCMLKDLPVELDIYGDGDLRVQLQEKIDESKLRVNLKGRIADVSRVIGEYDGFVMVSKYEGFGIAVAEAMAAGKPLILSDIPVLREITRGNAIFVDPESASSFAKKIRELFSLPDLLYKTVEINKGTARTFYSKQKYLHTLLSIYSKIVR